MPSLVPENLWIRLSYGSIAARRRDWDGAINALRRFETAFRCAAGICGPWRRASGGGRLDEADLTLARP